MIDNICNFLTKQIRKKMPEVDDERAEVIQYGLLLIIGEIPKIIFIIIIAFLIGIGKETLIAILVISPYKTFSGGIHLKKHITCFISTSAFYMGTAVIGKYLPIEISLYQIIAVILVWIFSVVMITLYAPADTVNLPILRKKERILKKIMSYITMTGTLIIAIIVKDNVILSITICGMFLQTIMITKFIYHLSGNKYGYEEYMKEKNKKKLATE